VTSGQPGAPANSGKQSLLGITPAKRSDGPTHDPDSPDNTDKKHWIEIELQDEEGNPIPGEAYKITLPDGSTLADRTLDEKGCACVDHIDPGTCQVSFPNLDQDAWGPK
jgi:type VI secretion system secreted protein VgrG